MKFRAVVALVVAVCAVAPKNAFAFGETAAQPAKGHKATGAPIPLQGAPGSALTPTEAVIRANDYFNASPTLVADFVQLGSDGRRLEGKLYVRKPGRMRFEYDPPAPLQIVADGTSVAIKDMKLHKQDLYFIGQTPLKFLLQDRINLSRDTKVLNVASDPQTTTINIEDSNTFSGTSRIALLFDTASFQLKQWVVTDPQGYETTVSLFNVRSDLVPDMEYFRIEGQNLIGTRK